MQGKVEWISIRPVKKGPVVAVDSVHASLENGLEGDHVTQDHRQVTLISSEGLKDVAQSLGTESIDPSKTRRNIVVSGLDFEQLDHARIRIGKALIEVTGICYPCQQMDHNLGHGGRAAMAGTRAGLTARVLESGQISVGDDVST